MELESYGMKIISIMNGFDSSFRMSCEENIVPEIRTNTMSEQRLEDVFHVSET